jgi:recombinational DNA repair protein RecT
MSEQTKTVTTRNPQQEFRQTVTRISGLLLSEWVGEARASEAIGRVSTAIAAAASSSKNPADVYGCTAQSVATVVAISALTGIMPGTGAGALAYVVPRSVRRGEQKQLCYQLSHRGLCALAERCGTKIIPIPVAVTDSIEVTADGEVRVNQIDVDNPPTTEAELRGVIVLIKDRETGRVIFTGFVPRKLINARRAVSQDYRYSGENSIWGTWYVEQAMKTAIHYAVGRGWAVIDDTAVQKALTIDVEAEMIQAASKPALTLDEALGDPAAITSDVTEGGTDEA